MVFPVDRGRETRQREPEAGAAQDLQLVCLFVCFFTPETYCTSPSGHPATWLYVPLSLFINDRSVSYSRDLPFPISQLTSSR